jgi:uncharacterized protein DUF4159
MIGAQTNGSVAQLRRVNPYPGLMIDAQVWRDAHEYHRDLVRLHHLALHGWGIVQGLDVSLVPGADNTLRIQPGIAIDPGGNFVVVGQQQTYRIMSHEPGPVYLVLQFSEVLGEPATDGAGRGQPTRVIEAYRIQERDRLPTDAYVELVRVELDPAAGSLREPHDPAAPGPNELDGRARVQIGSTTVPTELRLPPPVPLTSEASSSSAPDTLSPRVDELAAQLRELTRRVETVPAPPPAVSSGDEAAASSAYVQQLGQQVQQVNDELRQVAEQMSTLAAAAPASPAPINSPQVDALAQRVQSLAQDVETLGFQVQALASRPVEVPPPPVPPVVTSAPGRVQLRLALVDHGAPGWDQHRQGVRLLAREIGLTASDLAPTAVEPITPGGADGVDVLFLCGVAALSLNDDDVQAIGGLLERGGVVVGEGCAAGPTAEAGAREFAMSFVELASRLGRQLSRVDREHPLLNARHVFGEPPPGARGTPRVLEAGGMVYSDADYGCAWQGGPTDRALPRSSVRESIEFGTNLALYRRP